jgi:hypothetical protein
MSLALSTHRVMGFDLKPWMRATPLEGISRVSDEIKDQLSTKALTPANTIATAESGTVVSVPKSEADRLFDTRVQLKVLAAQVAMHVTNPWRDRLFKQIDGLLDPAEWCPGDAYPQIPSWWTFLRTMLHLRPARRPGLGLTREGYLVGAWDASGDQLTLTFLPADQIRWSVSCMIDGIRERTSSNTQVIRLSTVLAPYDSKRWFDLGTTSPPV